MAAPKRGRGRCRHPVPRFPPPAGLTGKNSEQTGRSVKISPNSRTSRLKSGGLSVILPVEAGGEDKPGKRGGIRPEQEQPE
jgi:hypothetical protein